MTTFDEIFDRIKLATNTKTQMELADVLDIRQSSISDAKRRNSVPADWYMKLFSRFGLNPDWLKNAVGPMYLRTEQGYAPVDMPAGGHLFEDAAQYGEPDAKSAVVSVYSTLPVADGSPRQSIGKLNIPMSYSHPGLHVVRIDSSSMEPCLRKGAFVGLDTTQRHVVSGELYGVDLPYEGLSIKNVYLDAQNSRIILRSHNAAHPETELPLEGHDKHIAGRVTWVLQRL